MTEPTTMTKRNVASFALNHDAWGRLVLIDAEGERHVGVEPIRAFPISDPNRFISICDGNGREIVAVDSLHDLPAELSRTLAGELRAEFIPLIERIVRVAVEKEPAEWEVETDRGPVTFLIGSADDVRRLDRDRATVTDMQGIRYLIASIEHLDARSRRLLEHFI